MSGERVDTDELRAIYRRGMLDADADAVLLAAADELDALRSALRRTEANFRAAVNGQPVRDMAENLAENAAALGRTSLSGMLADAGVPAYTDPSAS